MHGSTERASARVVALRRDRSGLGRHGSRSGGVQPRGLFDLDQGPGEGAYLRLAAALAAADGTDRDDVATWRERAAAIAAAVALPGVVGGVARAARLVGARERDYRRWLAEGRAWLCTLGAAVGGVHVECGPVPLIPQNPAVRRRLVVAAACLASRGGS